MPKYVAKLLVLNDNPKYLRFVFGKAGMYVESITSLATSSAHGQFHRPAIVMARYDKKKQIDLLIDKADKRLQPKRIFKSVWKRPKSQDKIDAFIFNCAKNLLNLVKGKTLRIVCKNDKQLQQKFYDIFMKVNSEEKLECDFDYDEYDAVLWIRTYVDETICSKCQLKTKKHWFITLVDGL